MEIRHNWSLGEIGEIFNMPLIKLIGLANQAHQKYFNASEIQISSLVSIKSGACPEDCNYCAQSARYDTELKPTKLMSVNELLPMAIKARDLGGSRLCLGAAWREVKDNKDFDTVLEMVKAVTNLNMEVCCTLGMLTEEQALKLKDVGLYAYNHNIDTSPDHYENIISTRNFNDRINTISNVKNAKLRVCSGVIIGTGESDMDRIKMLQTLANLPTHPDSVPINALVAIKGTPLENQDKVTIWEMVRMIATAKILMPQSIVRLAAGRNSMSDEQQTLCFLAGASSIFMGEKLLTTPNNDINQDQELFKILGITPKEPFNEEHHA